MPRVPRFLFSDFPLGNWPASRTTSDSQARTLELALRCWRARVGPRTTMQSPLRWSEDGAWKLDYLNVARIAARGARRAAAPSSTSRRRSRASRAAGRRRRDAMTPPVRRRRRSSTSRRCSPDPTRSYQLALLGADVIKVERREGEDMRRTPLSREWAERGMAPAWLAINGNKRSLTLDLQKPAAIEIVKRLAAKADVVMENFRPGVMDRLGIGYEALRAINPRLIYCADLRLRQHRPVSQRGRLRRQDPGAVRHHVDHRPSRRWARRAPASRCATCCPA